MMYKLQNYKDGAIYKTNDGYLVKTHRGEGKGKTVYEALRELSKAQSYYFEKLTPKLTPKKKRAKK